MPTERPGPSWPLTGGFLAAALVFGAALGALEINGLASPLDRIENVTLDWRFLLAGARPAPPGIVIVAVDDEALRDARGNAVVVLGVTAAGAADSFAPPLDRGA